MKHWQGRLALVALALSCITAHAGEVYKCTVHGAVVFQDQPCPGQPASAGRQSGAALVGIDDASPVALMARMQALAQQERSLSAQREQERLHLKARWDGNPDKAAATVQAQRFNQDWQQRFAVLRQENEAVRARLRALCPGGAASSGGRVSCSPAVAR